MRVEAGLSERPDIRFRIDVDETLGTVGMKPPHQARQELGGLMGED
jgi:hypothetical protein